MITPTHYMLLSAALFIIGVVGVMVRRNIIIIFMSIELILNAVNINLVAFSNQLQNAIGQVFVIFVIAVAAAESGAGRPARTSCPRMPASRWAAAPAPAPRRTPDRRRGCRRRRT